jgi:hypothetical protein
MMNVRDWRTTLQLPVSASGMDAKENDATAKHRSLWALDRLCCGDSTRASAYYLGTASMMFEKRHDQPRQEKVFVDHRLKMKLTKSRHSPYSSPVRSTGLSCEFPSKWRKKQKPIAAVGLARRETQRGPLNWSPAKVTPVVASRTAALIKSRPNRQETMTMLQLGETASWLFVGSPAKTGQ